MCPKPPQRAKKTQNTLQLHSMIITDGNESFQSFGPLSSVPGGSALTLLSGSCRWAPWVDLNSLSRKELSRQIRPIVRPSGCQNPSLRQPLESLKQALCAPCVTVLPSSLLLASPWSWAAATPGRGERNLLWVRAEWGAVTSPPAPEGLESRTALSTGNCRARTRAME